MYNDRCRSSMMIIIMIMIKELELATNEKCPVKLFCKAVFEFIFSMHQESVLLKTKKALTMLVGAEIACIASSVIDDVSLLTHKHRRLKVPPSLLPNKVSFYFITEPFLLISEFNHRIVV